MPEDATEVPGVRRRREDGELIQNSQELADGSLDPARLKPDAPGFGAATGTSSPPTSQVQLRFSR